MLDRLAKRLSGDPGQRRIPAGVRWVVVAALVFMTLWGFVRSLA